MPTHAVVGYVGKLPSRGDFLADGLPQSVRAPLEAFLQEGVARCDLSNGKCADRFLTSPLWRFAIRAGLIGPHALCGGISPSVDAGGRIFPFCVVAALAGDVVPGDYLSTEGPWLAKVEAAILAQLSPDGNPDHLLAEIGKPVTSGGGGLPFTLPAVSERQVKHDLDDGDFLTSGLDDLAGREESYGSSWWRDGGAVRVSTTGVPGPSDLAFLFLGDGMGVAGDNTDGEIAQ